MPTGIEKERLCLSLGASSANPLIQHAVKEFNRRVRGLKGSMPEWQFAVTGDMEGYSGPMADRVQFMGMLDDPYTAVAKASAIALLSGYGGGFKTKILEAMVAKARLLAPRSLLKKLPEVLLPYCIEVVPGSTRSFAEALEQCAEPFPGGSRMRN